MRENNEKERRNTYQCCQIEQIMPVSGFIRCLALPYCCCLLLAVGSVIGRLCLVTRGWVIVSARPERRNRCALPWCHVGMTIICAIACFPSLLWLLSVSCPLVLLRSARVCVCVCAVSCSLSLCLLPVYWISRSMPTELVVVVVVVVSAAAISVPFQLSRVSVCRWPCPVWVVRVEATPPPPPSSNENHTPPSKQARKQTRRRRRKQGQKDLLRPQRRQFFSTSNMRRIADVVQPCLRAPTTRRAFMKTTIHCSPTFRILNTIHGIFQTHGRRIFVPIPTVPSCSVWRKENKTRSKATERENANERGLCLFLFFFPPCHRKKKGTHASVVSTTQNGNITTRVQSFLDCTVPIHDTLSLSTHTE